MGFRHCVIVASILVLGCGDDDGPGTDGGTDSGGTVDGGDVDGGGADAGDDSGSPGDGGSGMDGGAPYDAGYSMMCGDAVVDYDMNEECDDGNVADGDGCDSHCRREPSPTCGDAVLDFASGEECDDGNATPFDGCSPTCQLEPVGRSCGDGTVTSGEACDDANTANGDACNPTCNFTNTTTLFVGMPGSPGNMDGIGAAAQIGGGGTLAADNNFLWLADGSNLLVRRVEIATGTLDTVAGDGVSRLVDSPFGIFASFGNLESITTDGTTVWVSDSRRIRAIDVLPPHEVTTVAGSGATMGCMDGTGSAMQAEDLRGVTYYGGYVYFLDAVCATLRRLDPTTGDVVTLAGSPYMTGLADGIGSAARFTSPRYMTSDNSGMLYVADTNGATIRAFNTVTNEVTTFAGTGVQGYVDGIGTAAQVHRPRGMTSDGTSIYWVEFNQHTIRQGVLATQSVTTMIGAPGMNGYTEGVGAAARMDTPWALAFHFPSRSLFFLDGANAVIRRIQ